MAQDLSPMDMSSMIAFRNKLTAFHRCGLKTLGESKIGGLFRRRYDFVIVTSEILKA